MYLLAICMTYIGLYLDRVTIHRTKYMMQRLLCQVLVVSSSIIYMSINVFFLYFYSFSCTNVVYSALSLPGGYSGFCSVDWFVHCLARGDLLGESSIAVPTRCIPRFPVS